MAFWKHLFRGQSAKKGRGGSAGSANVEQVNRRPTLTENYVRQPSGTVEGFTVIQCGCTLKLKIPSSYRSSQVICPKCKTIHDLFPPEAMPLSDKSLDLQLEKALDGGLLFKLHGELFLAFKKKLGSGRQLDPRSVRRLLENLTSANIWLDNSDTWSSALGPRSFDMRTRAGEIICSLDRNLIQRVGKGLDLRPVESRLTDKHTDEYALAAKVLEALGDERTIPALGKALLMDDINDWPRQFKVSITEALASMGMPAVPYLKAALSDVRPHVREDAAKALRKVFGGKGLPGEIRHLVAESERRAKLQQAEERKYNERRPKGLWWCETCKGYMNPKIVDHYSADLMETLTDEVCSVCGGNIWSERRYCSNCKRGRLCEVSAPVQVPKGQILRGQPVKKHCLMCGAEVPSDAVMC